MTQRKAPRVVAFIGQKGGSGKTTLAVHAAVAAQGDGELVAIIDTDPQMSATSWGESRKSAYPPVATATPEQVEEVIRVATEEGITLVVIDTPPHAVAGVPKAIARADLIVLPCRPTAFDLKAAGAAVAIANATRKPSMFVLNACQPRIAEVGESRAILAEYGLPVAPVEIGNRMSYSRAISTGESVTEFEPYGRAAEEIRELWNYIKEQFPREH